MSDPKAPPTSGLPLPGKEPGEDKAKAPKFKRSGHLTDQILKYTYPKDKALSSPSLIPSRTVLKRI